MADQPPAMPHYSTDRFFAQAWHLRPYEDVPLPVAIELAQVVNEACSWFHDRRHLFLGDPSAPALPDHVVDEVCDALQHQMDKEGESRTRGATCSRHGVAHTAWYHLADLPPARRRALVERVWALKQRHAIEVRLWTDETPPPAPQPPYAPFDALWP
jgi:hypothetical protein